MSNCHLFSVSGMFTQTEIKENVKDDSIALIETFGFYEYFDARKGKSNVGYGGKNFSWTAALLIDLLNDN